MPSVNYNEIKLEKEGNGKSLLPIPLAPDSAQKRKKEDSKKQRPMITNSQSSPSGETGSSQDDVDELQGDHEVIGQKRQHDREREIGHVKKKRKASPAMMSEPINEALKRNYEELRSDMGALIEEVQDLRTKLYGTGAVASDATIREEFLSIAFDIRQFACRFASNLRENLDPEAVKKLRHIHTITDKIEHFLAQPYLRQKLLESWIWLSILKAVAPTDALVWGGDIGSSVYRTVVLSKSRINDDSSPLYAELQAWRSRSVILFESIHRGNRDTQIKKLATEIAIDLFEVLGDKNNQIPGVRDDLYCLVKKVVDLDVVLRKSKASFHWIMRFRGTPVNRRFGDPIVPRYMEYDENAESLGLTYTDSEFIVDLIASPALIKSGNSDGVDYQKRTVICKQQVICNVKTEDSSTE
ncbi:hypothetical protein M406DRAFT_69341 [Cryphonectria parasitica EP155]|uniref:Uncharacterized protein n=1 Tax=Cryphonectria parasitica (strain ATCC 38755 / EP155) TaxID=660469 RepID=A0A9P5CRJ9_CRYP1|nr:uncharacterized protein M406DRAFT_69341 [Cryphonectria parasitica EP155]KAF3767180.1 hypothetical protein M406DRAFT_69341 [Cryphonectria parasitica EP155]